MPLSAAQEKYQLWLGTPKTMRPTEYKTEAQISAALRTPIATLRMWELLPGWWDGVYSSARTIIGREMTDIMDSMLERARSGSVPAAKLCLQILDVHADEIRIKGQMVNEQLVLMLTKEPDAKP